MKAIVLGATGFIGSHITRALIQEGLDVRILRRSSSPTLALEGLKFETVVGDLNDKASLQKAFRGCDVLFHVAGYYMLYSLERERQKKMALQQMRNVLETARESKFTKIIYTSSMSTIGKTKDGSHSNEDTPYDPKYFTGLYYETKYILEQEALKETQAGLPIVMVNPTGVFGDYDVKPTSGSLVVAIASGKLPVLFDSKMNAVDVHDVAKGQIAAMKVGRVGRRYILGGHNTTVWELARLIARIAKVRPPKIKLPLFLGIGAAYASEYLGRYVFHQEKPLVPLVGIDFLKYGTHYDTTRARTELDFKKTPLEETFERAVGWFRRHHYF